MITEVFSLNRIEFEKEIAPFYDAQILDERIKRTIKTTRDLSIIGIQCYVCKEKGHLSVDCKQFDKIRGNLKDTPVKDSIP